MVDASGAIDGRIRELGDWRGEMLARMRGIVRGADAEIMEEWKWRGVPVWSRGGIVCTGETYKSVVKLTFAKGAALPDPAGLFNSSLDGNVRRAIDIREGERVDEEALKKLVRAAVALNLAGRSKGGSKGGSGDKGKNKDKSEDVNKDINKGKGTSVAKAGRVSAKRVG